MRVPDSTGVWREDHVGHLHHALPHRLPHECRRRHPPDRQDPNHKYTEHQLDITCNFLQINSNVACSGQYYFILLVFTTFATVMAVIVLKIHHRFHRSNPPHQLFIASQNIDD